MDRLTLDHEEDLMRPFRNVYIYFALLIPAAVLAFAKTFFAGVTISGKPLTDLLRIHTALMVLWLLMLIAQAWFIRTKRFRLHRWVGRSSYMIAPLIVLLGLATLHEVLNRTPGGVPSEGPEGARLGVFGFGQMLAFGIAWGLAIVNRKDTPRHVRFIVSTTFAIAPAIVLRILPSWVPGFDTENAAVAGNCFVLTFLLLVLIAADWRMGVKRSPFWVVTILISVMHLGYWTFAKTDGWLVFCQWFADLPSLGS